LLATLFAVAATLTSLAYGAQVPEDGTRVAPIGNSLPPLFDTLQERTFQYFWDTADPDTGLVPDRFPSPSVSSIAAVGFALTAYPIGVERGYVTRAPARHRVPPTLPLLATHRGSRPAWPGTRDFLSLPGQERPPALAVCRP
jgi:hypothetical protein